MIWDTIASLLTEKWLSEGKLPMEVDDMANQADRIIFTSTNGKGQFRLAYLDNFKGETGNRPYHVLSRELNKAYILREVWEVLTEQQKTLIMT